MDRLRGKREVPAGSWWSYSKLNYHEASWAVLHIKPRRPETPSDIVEACVFTTTQGWQGLSGDEINELVNKGLATHLSELTITEFWQMVKKGELQRIDSPQG